MAGELTADVRWIGAQLRALNACYRLSWLLGDILIMDALHRARPFSYAVLQSRPPGGMIFSLPPSLERR